MVEEHNASTQKRLESLEDKEVKYIWNREDVDKVRNYLKSFLDDEVSFDFRFF